MYLIFSRYWKPILIVLFGLAVYFLWQYDRAAQYRAGGQVVRQEFQAKLEKERAEQVRRVLEKERQAAAKLAEKQAEVEKEKENAKIAINDLRGELGRLQQHIADKSSVRNRNKAAVAASAPDETTAKGWQLFGKCAAEYAGMAEVADRQRNDLAEWQAYGKVIQEQFN